MEQEKKSVFLWELYLQEAWLFGPGGSDEGSGVCLMVSYPKFGISTWEERSLSTPIRAEVISVSDRFV